MNSPCNRSERQLQRHQLVFVSPEGWRGALSAHASWPVEPLVLSWARRGLPLVTRRALPGEAPGVTLGLPLPPSAGKRRLSLRVRPGDIEAVCPPPELGRVIRDAPISWWPTLERLGRLASRHGAEARVFGGLAWQSLTELDYLTASSDLDLLLYLGRGTDPEALADSLAAIEAAAPMRIDGELIRPDGAAVNWREFLGASPEVLVKTMAGVSLLRRESFSDTRIVH